MDKPVVKVDITKAYGKYDLSHVNMNLVSNPFIQDRATIELEFEKWRQKQIPVAKNSVQAFIVFLRENGLWDDNKVRAWCREKEFE